MQSTNNIRKRKLLVRSAKITGWIVLGVTTLLLAVSLIIYLSREKIKEYLINEINKHLLTEIQVGDVDITVFSTFPYVSLDFHDVIIPEVINGQRGEGVLITAEKVYLQFNFWDVLRKRYKLRRVNISQADCHMKIMKDGSTNYEFWKKDTSDDSSAAFELLLRRVRLDKIKYRYDNDMSDVSLSLFAEKFTMSGAFYEENFDITVKGQMVSDYLIIGNNTFLSGVPHSCSGKMHADIVENFYTFKDLTFNFSGVSLLFNGTYSHKDQPYFDLTASNEKSKLADFEALLPESVTHYLEPFSKKGNVKINALLKGPLSDTRMPSLYLDVKLEKGNLSRNESNVSLDMLEFDASFSCDDLLRPENSKIICRQFSAQPGSGFVKGKFSIEGFSPSAVSIQMEAQLELNEIQDLFRFENIDNIAGRVSCSIDYQGGFADAANITVSDFLNTSSTGHISSDRIDLRLKGYNENLYLYALSGRFNQKDLEIDNLQIKICESDFLIYGKAVNIFPYLFVSEQQLFLRGDVQSDLVNVDRLFAANISNSSHSDKVYVDFPEFIRLDWNINFKELHYSTFSCKDVKANLILNNKVLLFRDMTFKTMDGSVSAEVIIDARPEKNFEFRVMTTVKNMNITKAFEDLNNFGQSSMTHQHLTGFLDGTIHVSSLWTKDLRVDLHSLTVVSDIQIRNGSIRNYEPLAGLRKYFRRRDFSNVEFATLTNQIVIRDSEILIPQMTINSSVMNFEMQGTHYFDNKINYNFKIRFSELLKKDRNDGKARAEDEYGTISEENENKLIWHFKVTGTVDEPKFVALDMQSVTTKVKEDLRQEGKTAVEILKKEFGNKRDSTEIIIEHTDGESPKILIEWDDD
jgi:hypothetical protein